VRKPLPHPDIHRDSSDQTEPLPYPDVHRDGSDSESSKESIRLVTAPDRRAEVAAAVRTLVDLVQRPDAPLRYRDIAVVVRDLTPYHDLLSAALRAHGIPFFIDRRRPTYHHPLVQLVRSVLAMQADAPFEQAIASVLKSGLSGLEDSTADTLENYVLAHGLVAPEVWNQEWTHCVTPGDEDHPPSFVAQQQLAAINAARARLLERLGEWWPGPAAKHGQPAAQEQSHLPLLRRGEQGGVEPLDGPERQHHPLVAELDRPEHLLRRGGERALLDREVERYRDQLARYARFVRALDPRPIRLGIRRGDRVEPFAVRSPDKRD
jgi:hypothetical protein